MSIHYRVQAVRPETHTLSVSCTLCDPAPEGQVFAMPTWTPGSYLLREYAKHIVSLRAEDGDGAPVAVEKLDKASWRCAPCRGPLRLHYELFCYDLTVRTAHIDHTHVFFTGAAVFMQAQGWENQPCTVDLVAPESGAYQHWQVATGMPRADAPPRGFGRYQAADYDALLDYPVEIGALTWADFAVDGVLHEIALYGRQRADLPRLCEDLREICASHARLFGGLPDDMERYVFLISAVGDAYGGLEHRNSCALICKRADLPQAGHSGVSKGYRRFLGLCSHEYFHLWNVKRIKPAVFMPYDLSRESYTRLLWVFEGITSYYDDLGLLRSARITVESYLQLLSELISKVLQQPGQNRQSLADASFDTWIKLYRPDGNSPNALSNYYSKGALLALLLDLQLRERSAGRYSLDDLMQRLWTKHGQPGIGLAEEGIPEQLEALSGLNFDAFFRRYLHAAEALPLEEWLALFGVDMQLQARADKDAPHSALGVRHKSASGGVKLTHILAERPAWQAGLAPGDILLAVDGLRVTEKNLDTLLAAHPPGSVVETHVFRRDELMRFKVELAAAPLDTCVLRLAVAPDAETLARRRTWLGC